MNDFNELIVVRVLISRQQSAPSVATLLQIQSRQCTSLAAQKKRVWTYHSCQKRWIAPSLLLPFVAVELFILVVFLDLVIVLSSPVYAFPFLITRIRIIPYPYHHYYLSLSSVYTLFPIRIILTQS